uniref:protein-tyrosine-phosphatase n=3 Tax=Apis cerana TaxID=7461 RepID=V9IID8_APICE
MTSILVYVVDEKGKFDTNMTKILPSLYEESRDRITFPIKIQRFLLVQETIPDSGNAVAAIVVSSVALICLVLLAGLLFIMRKRQTRFNYGERCRPVSLDAYSLDSVSAYNSVRRKGVARSSKRSYGNPTFEDSSAIPSHPLNFAGLSSFCNDINAINEEFAGIPQVSAKIDELPAGAEVKNRYANVIPLPETRVLLQKINNDPLTEYINASYVRGPKNATKYYIACQAPMESTVTDFWRMIWEQQSKVIIMLTDLVENGVEKCTEYIPPSEITDCRRLYGDFQVTLKKRETKEKYAISTLHLNNLEKNTFREVYHIWYLWPVNGVQSDGAGLIAVLLEARALQRGGPGPIVVHCSPGTGRTGTLIALDLGIRQYEITRTVDVPRVVYTIRRDRAGAVKTKEQYAFIYKALNLYATKLAGGVLEST